MQRTIILEPAQEETPSGVMDAFGEMPVPDHIVYLKLLIGNQIARCDERVRLLAGEIFTLPLHFQIRFRQLLAGTLAVLALLLFTGELSVESLEFLFRFPMVPRVLESVSLRVGREGFQAHINADLPPSGNVGNLPLGFHAKLDVVAIRTVHDAHAFDLLRGESFDLLPWIADEPQTPNATAIREGDVSPIWR